MFDKLEKIKQLKDMQAALAQEKVEKEEKGIKVIINGKMEIEEIILNQELEQSEQEKVLKRLINEGFKDIQAIATRKMSGMNIF